MKRKQPVLIGFFLIAASFLFVAGCHDEHKTSSTAKGKVIQAPVEGARVFLDIDGDRVWDEGTEPSDVTDANGNYEIRIPDDVDGVLCSLGGSYKNSAGEDVAALPMLAPRPHKGRDANISALTTLAALNPGLKQIMGEQWNNDPYNESMSGELLRLKIVVERYIKSIRDDLEGDYKLQLSAVMLFASALDEKKVNLAIDKEINEAINIALFEALKASLVGKTILTPEQIKAIDSASQLPAFLKGAYDKMSDNLSVFVGNIDPEKIEGNISIEEIDKIEKEAEIVKIAFNPTTQNIPLPNSLAWASNEDKAVTLPVSTEEDASKKALYTAINSLKLKGLSPNTLISVPFTSEKELDISLVKANLLVINLTQLLSAKEPQPLSTYIVANDNFAIIQEKNFIKIYPLKPLGSGSTYLVVLRDGIKTIGDEAVAKNQLFELLKTDANTDGSTPELGSDDLEKVWEGYSSIFAALDKYQITRDNILTLFTFSTASKTLSVADLSEISKALATGSDLSSMNITGLEYADDKIKSEYATFNSVIPLRVAGSSSSGVPAMTVDEDSFSSWKIASISNLQQGSLPEDEDVTYTVLNKDTYNGTVVIFQHGFLGYKEQAQAFAVNHTSVPVISMDLPLHGDRDATPDDDTDSGLTYLTANIGQDRINFYQSFFDMSVFVQGLKLGKFDIDGDGVKDLPQKIHFVGISLGSITGSVVANYNSTAVESSLGNGLDNVVLNVGGANFSALVDSAKNSLFTSLMESFGLTKNSPEYFTTLGILQLLLDSADPVYLADGVADKISKTVFQYAYKDTIVSNISNEILTKVANAGDISVISDFSVTYPFDSAKAFVFGEQQDKSDNWIPHGFLLDPTVVKADGTYKYPEAKGYMDEDYVTEAYSAVNSWTSQFLNN